MISAIPLLLSASLDAELLAVPATLPLTTDGITLLLTYADLDLTIQNDAAPSLHARAFDTEGREVVSQLEILTEGGRTVIRRPVTGESKHALIDLRLVLPRPQQIRVAGRDLRFSARVTAPAATVTQEASPRWLEIEAERSDVNLQRILSPFLDVESSVLELEDCGGDLAIRLDRSKARIVGAAGSLKLIGKDSDFVVQRARGPIRLNFDLRQSSLDVFLADLQEGQGSAAGGSVTFDEWQGHLILEVDQAVTSLRTTSTAQPQLDLKAQQADITIDGLRGPSFMKLAGGTLNGRGLDMSTQVIAVAEAVARLEDSAGEIKVNLSDRSRATLVDLRGHVRLVATDGAAEADGIKVLNIEAIRAEVSATHVERLEAVIATDARVNLDLTAAETISALILRGQSFAQVRLDQPCLVRLSTLSTLVEDQVKVTGCELPLVNVGKHPAISQAETVVLTASLRDSSRLEVEGVKR